MADPLDYEFLRTASPQEVALHLRRITLSEQHSPDAITEQLLHGVESEALPPMVYALWTSSCPDHSATLAGLQQSHSIIVRSSAIRNFRRKFRTAECESLWRTLDGTEGVVQMLRSFSVIHVKEFCKAVARCSTSKHTTSKRQELVTDLLQTLMSKQQDADDRSLHDLYAKLVYTCTPEQKDAWISQHGTADLDMAKLFETDVSLHRSRCLEAINTCGGTLDGDFGRYSPLFNFIPREPDPTDVTVSSSMVFALQALQLIQQLKIKLEDADWLDRIMRSLLARLVRKKVSAEYTSEALDAMAYCAPQRPGKRPRGTLWRRKDAEEKYWLNIMRLWQRDPSLYERKLTPLVRSHKQSLDMSPRYSSDENNIEAHVLSAKFEHRYRLLRWILANHHQHRIDIEDASQLRHKNIEPMSERLMLSLPRDDALRLFDQFEAARPGKLKLATRDMRELDKTGDRPLGELLRLHLLDDQDTVFRQGQNRTQNSKQMAEDSGSQPIRSAWINASVYFAVASRSLDLLHDTVIWARRFSRDPKTVQELYGSSPYGGEVFRDGKTVSLLSGIPERLPPDWTLSDVQRDVRKGNEITLELLHSAVLAQSEPFFQSRHWESVFLLYRKIVEARLRRVNALQSRLKLTDNEVYSIVWQATLETLLKAEEIGLKRKDESLDFSGIGGPLRFRGDRQTASTPLSAATLRFIDQLAIQRDSDWAQLRLRANPAVATLDAPWPRGLPIQALWFLDSKDDKRLRGLEGSLPFLASKAKSVVFMAAEHVLRPKPDDQKMRSAIVGCVDDYALALRLYLSWCTPTKKESRIQDAWIHATETLRDNRMTALESRSYWKDIFAGAGATPTALMMGVSLHKDPQLPNQGSATDPIKWHPDAYAKSAGDKRRRLDTLVVDCFREGTLTPYRSWIDKVSVGNFWDLKRYGSSTAHVPGEAREAFIAAAILALNSRSGAGIAVFGQPFPITRPRFPALFLDEEAFKSQKPSDKDLTNVLERLLSAIPASLLLSLASGLVEKSLAENTRSNALREWTSFALRLLVRSDKPQLATELITRIISENPGETPWHQALLTAGYLKRLPPDCAKNLVQDLTKAIVQRLDGQSNSSEPAEGPNKEAPGPYTANISTVKVTTVKLLAQVLKEASFLGDDFIMDALATLFDKATHVHIRAVIVDSLASVLLGSHSDRVREAIVKFLETTVVPVAAELNERSPMTEDDWKVAVQADTPPEVYSDAGFAPICAALVKAVKSSSKSESVRTYPLVDRILLPLIQRSRENNTRWLEIFLRKHDASHLVTQIPTSPSKPQLLEVLLLKFAKNMPAAEFVNFSDALTFVICLPKYCREFTTGLESRPEVYKHNDTRHWLRITEGLYIPRPKRQSKVSTVTDYPEIVKSLQTAQFASAEEATARDLITPANLQAHERKILDLLATDFPTSLETWKTHTAIYEPPLEGKPSEACQRWQIHCRPLVQHAVSLVESLRTEDWQRNPHREPSVLPDVFQLQLWLLPYPNLYPSSERDQHVADFASEVRDVVQRLAANGKPYHTRWPLLQQALQKCPKQDYITLALQLGSLGGDGDTDPTLAECLCVELADGLLKGTEELSVGEIEAARGMLGTWRTCFDEDVRCRGEKGLGWIKGKVPAVPSLERDEEEEGEGEVYDEESDESDGSEYDEDY
jgi:hypothetical protein